MQYMHREYVKIIIPFIDSLLGIILIKREGIMNAFQNYLQYNIIAFLIKFIKKKSIIKRIMNNNIIIV
jgi:hypothetical protein